MRTIRTDIESLRTATLEIGLEENQVFYELPKSYEIWNMIPQERVKRISRKRVLWVIPKKNWEVEIKNLILVPRKTDINDKKPHRINQDTNGLI